MKYLIMLILSIIISGCSVQIVDMAPSTVQNFDLTDNDTDGVILARDRCSESIVGTKVDNVGCGAEKLNKLRQKLEVNFDNNSYQVKPEFYPRIGVLADFMKDHPSANVTIEGHTSILGSKVLNKRLSQNRAQSVRSILINQFGIAKDRVKAIGYGFEKLLVEGDTPEIHARNRRIVAEISSEVRINDMKWTIYSVEGPTK